MTVFRYLAIVGLTAGHVLAGGSCVVVRGTVIHASDVQRAIPGFHPTSPDRAVGFAPLPGVERVFSPRDLTTIVKEYGSITDESDLRRPISFCMETHVLEPAEVRAEIAQLLQIEMTDVTVINLSKNVLPAGRIEFTLPPRAKGPSIRYLYGSLRAESGRSYPIWAQVSADIEQRVVLPKRSLPRGYELHREDFDLKTMRISAFGERFVSDAETAVGRILTRSVNAGEPLLEIALETPNLVRSGQIVQVESLFGNAEIRFPGLAEGSGRKGEWVLVRNPSSGKSFRAVVVDRGQVRVTDGRRG